MNQESLLLYGKYLTDCLSCVLKNKAAPLPPDNIDIETFFKFATEHSVANMVYYALKDNALPEESLQKFYENYKYMTLLEAKTELMATRLFKTFDDAGICYSPMKGIVIKKLYPVDSMRNSSDTDVLVHRADREHIEVIAAQMGFQTSFSDEKQIVLKKPPVYMFELHFDPVYRNSRFYPFLAKRYKAAYENRTSNRYSLTREDEYIFLLIHLRKHFIEGGCGVRFFLDMYVYLNSGKLDYNYICEQLISLELFDFHERIAQLCRVMFDGAKPNENLNALLAFVYSNGVFGNSENREVSSINDRNQGSFKRRRRKYFLRQWFEPLDSMKRKYKTLEKLPVLLPFFWIVKAFRAVFMRHGTVRSEIKRIKSYTPERSEYLAKIQSLAGLK